MKAKLDVKNNSAADTALLALTVVLLAAGIFVFYYYGAQPLVVRVGGILLAAVLAGACAYQTQLGTDSWKFMQSSRTELRKMVWPSREETMQTTLAVIAMVLALGIFMWLLDLLLFWAFSPITGQSGS